MSMEVEQRGAIRMLRINRPDRLNALDEESNRACKEFFEGVRDDPEVRAAIITGTGDRSFCAGSDLKAGANSPMKVSVGGITKDVHIFKPVIAAINGLAFGGGLEIVLACDMRIAVPSATFAVPEAKVGLFAGGGGAVRLAYNLPWAIASEMHLRSRVLGAEEALHFGLINKIVEPDELIDTTWRWAEEAASHAPLALAAAKEVQWRSRGMDLMSALAIEEEYSTRIKTSKDAAEGVEAFQQKRTPRFTGE